jgi:hypothetical protein
MGLFNVLIFAFICVPLYSLNGYQSRWTALIEAIQQTIYKYSTAKKSLFKYEYLYERNLPGTAECSTISLLIDVKFSLGYFVVHQIIELEMYKRKWKVVFFQKKIASYKLVQSLEEVRQFERENWIFQRFKRCFRAIHIKLGNTFEAPPAHIFIYI